MDNVSQSTTSFPTPNNLDTIRYILEQEGNPNRCVGSNDTSLHLAAKTPDSFDVLTKLIKSGAKLDLKNDLGETPLHVAVIHRNHSAVSTLNQYGELVNNIDGLGNSILHSAISVCVINHQTVECVNANCNHPPPDLDIIRTLLQNVCLNVNVRNKGGYTPLLIAVKLKNFEIVDALLARSANVNLGNCFHETPLHAAVSYKYNSNDIAFSLLFRKACVNCLDSNSKSPLDIAAGRFENVETRSLTMEFIKLVAFFDKNYEQCQSSLKVNDTLLEFYKNCCEEVNLMRKEILVDDVSMYDILLLRWDDLIHLASKTPASFHALTELIKSGANLYLKNALGETPLHVAVIHRNHRAVSTLIQYGEVNNIDGRGNSILHSAISVCVINHQDGECVNANCNHPPPDLDIIRTLLQNVCLDVNVRNKGGYTPLLIAVKLKNFEIVDTLLARSANVNLGNCFHETPLHAAVSCNDFSIQIVLSLLFRKACVWCLDSNGKSPLDIAAGRFENAETRASTIKFIKLVAFFDKNYEQCQSFLKVNDTLLEFYQNCCEEVNRMRKEIVVDEVSVHDFILSRWDKAYTPPIQICKTVVKTLICNIYPIYFAMILHSMTKCELHNVLVDSAVSLPYESLTCLNLYSLIVELKTAYCT